MSTPKTVDFFDVIIKIKKLYLGRVIAITDPENRTLTTKWKYAHITGFIRDERNNLMLKVRQEGVDEEVSVYAYNCVINIL